MDFGRHSHRPSLKKDISDRRLEMGRKSTAAGFTSKKFKPNISHKELEKYKEKDAQRLIRDKIIDLLIKLNMIKSEDNLDFKILEKNLNSFLKTVTILLQCIFPHFEAKSGGDIQDVAYKILQYPYEISSRAFTPLGAPNTWSQLVCFVDWLYEYIAFIGLAHDNDMIAEESNDDEFRRSSLDKSITRESSQFFAHLGNAPLLPHKSPFMRYVEKLRIQTKFDQAVGGGGKSGNIVNPQTLLEDEISKIKANIQQMTFKESSIQQTISEKEIKKKRVNEMEQQLQEFHENIKIIEDSLENLSRTIAHKASLISSTEGEIEQVREDIRALQAKINSQMLTAYEKEMAMQEIEKFNQKKSHLERSNSTISKEIHEGNREIHVSEFR
jgi:SMC interacting uncharacterized protein involved in chromosome segregation